MADMLRVGGFGEFSPSGQAQFDRLLGIVEEVYAKWWYEHIHTPAVEKNEVLLAKWWDEVSGQIFGLYGLKQWCEKDKKDYSLHFDLTVPLARYVLDWRNELKFPFKRYQIQPVWRGERQQKWRFKEFFQADIDTIFEWEGPLWYDVETLVVIGQALQRIFDEFDLPHRINIKVNSKKLILALFDHIGLNNSEQVELLKLFDRYYKISKQDFEAQLWAQIGKQKAQDLLALLGDFDGLLSKFDKEGELRWILAEFAKWQEALRLDRVELEFDPFVVRWLDYYTWMVFESFVQWEQSLGSIASGGRYEGLTKYIDSKTNFGGVGGSIGVNRLFSWLEQIKEFDSWQQKYLILRFEGIDNQDLANLMLKEGKIVVLYPSVDSLKKQFKFADKRGIRYVVIRWEQEQQQWIYKIKDLKTGDEKTYKL